MRHATTLFALAAFLLAAPLAAQPVVPIDPTPGAINGIINDPAVEPGTIFELQRGVRYLATDRINPQVSVTIRAAGDGDCVATFAGLEAGAFPGCALLQPVDPVGGADVQRIIDVRDHGPIDLTLEDLALTNTTPSGLTDSRMVRIRTDDTTLRGTDVVFYGEPEDVIRLDGPNARILLDTILGARIGAFDGDGNLLEGEGNFIDTRSTDVAEIAIENGTFYSVVNGILRVQRPTVGQITFRNNTIHLVRGQVMTEGGGEDGRALLENTRFENLMIIDAGFEGSDDEDAFEILEADTLAATGTHVYRNINVFVDDALVEGAGTGAVVLANDVIAPYLDSTTVLNEPPQTLNFAEAQPAFFEGFDEQPFDYAYTAGASLTAGTDGQPLGALVWFGLDVTPGSRQISVATEAELRAALDDLQSGDVITITDDLTITETIDPSADVTIRGAGDGVVLQAAVDGEAFEPEDDLTIENITVDGLGMVQEFVRVRSEDADDDDDDDVTLRNVVLYNNAADNDGIRFDGDAGSLLIVDSAIKEVGRRPLAVRPEGVLDELRLVRSTIASTADRARLQGTIADVVLDRVTIYEIGGDGIDFDSNTIGTVTITNSILIPSEGQDVLDYGDNTPPTFSITYTNVFPAEESLDDAAAAAFEAGTGNLTVDPMFADPENGDFSLPAGSPLLTAGEDGGPIGDPNVAALVDLSTEPVAEVPGAALKLQAYPNPAVGPATVAFELAAPAYARVEVFDVLGRRVALIKEGTYAAGLHTATLDATPLSPGLYLVRVATDTQTQTRNLVVLR